jgi:predicted nucleotidyltransferase
MTRQDAIAALREHASAVKALGATGLYMFGSTARDDAGLESDLDLFIDYDRGSRFSLVELIGIKQLLERRLGVQVDVTTRDSLDPLLKGGIEASAQRVF